MFKLLIVVIGIFLITGVYSYSTTYSNPSIETQEKNIPIKQDCPRNEWNQNFEDYRGGDVSREDMKLYVRSCK